jgi:hypothetical protein
MQETGNLNLGNDNDSENVHIQSTSDIKRLKILDKQKHLSEAKLKKQADLTELGNKLYEILPPVCWYTEKSLAAELGVSRRQIRKAKNYLLETGKILIKLKKNGNRANPRHYIYKIGSIDKNDPFPTKGSFIKWELLCNYSPQKFNALSIEEKLDIYEEMGIQFFPMHFPKFNKNREPFCSCKEGRYCDSIGKHPAIVLSEYDFSDKATLKKMRRFFDGMDNYDVPQECKEWGDRRDSRFNIGFLTNSFSVIDIDFRNGGAYSLELLEEIYGEIPRVFMSKSGNGLHFYTSSVINSTTNLLGFLGIDVRSRGGFIIAPGSLHKSGTYYEWESLWMPEPLSDDLLNEIQQSPNYISQTERKISKTLYIPKSPDEDYVIKDGTRCDTLFQIAIRERHKGKESEEILSIIEKFNTIMCSPPVKQSRLEHTARSASKYPVNSEVGKERLRGS